MRNYKLIMLYLFSLSFSGCAQDDKRLLSAFEGTEAHELAKAVEKEDLEQIEKIIEGSPSIMETSNPINGSNVLELSVDIEKYKSFQKLLQLGANPNYINMNTRYSVLINAIQPFGSQFEWRIDNRYVELLLDYGADPNYAVEQDFTNNNGHHIMAKSPLMEASGLDVETVRMLIKHGADPQKRVSNSSPFEQALSFKNQDVIKYYIDDLDIDIFQPIRIRKKDTLFIQDYIVNKYTKARIKGNVEEMKRLEQQNPKIAEANEALWALVKRLEEMGVDFINYDYKK